MKSWAIIGTHSTRVSVGSKGVQSVARKTSRVGKPPVLVLPPGPAFSLAPSIQSDGTPVVGELVILNFGIIVNGGVMGTCEILNASTDAVVATVTSGSYLLASAGTFKLRVHIAGSAVYADSAPITVAAAVTTSMTAPVLSWETGRVAGTNPPQIVVESTDASIDKNTDSLVIEIDRNASGAFVVASTVTIALTEITAVDQTLEKIELKGLAGGPIRLRARFTRPATTPSADSTVISDTLDAPVMAAATTTWDTVNKSNYIALTNTNRDAAGDAGVGAYMNVASTTSRNDRRFAEFNVITMGTVSYDKMFRIGIAPANVDATPNFSISAGAIWHTVDGNNFADTNYVLDITPSPDGVANGTMKVYRSGVLVATINHTLTSYKLVYGSQRDTKVRLNAGQDAFTFTPAGSTRWN